MDIIPCNLNTVKSFTRGGVMPTAPIRTWNFGRGCTTPFNIFFFMSNKQKSWNKQINFWDYLPRCKNKFYSRRHYINTMKTTFEFNLYINIKLLSSMDTFKQKCQDRLAVKKAFLSLLENLYFEKSLFTIKFK